MSTIPQELLSQGDLQRLDLYVEELGSGRLKVRDLNQALQHESPDLQAVISHFFRNMNYAEDGGRSMPFDVPVTQEQVERAYGLEDGSSRQVYQDALDNVITSGLMARMGVDELPPPSEPSMREVLDAAIDLHSQEDKS